MTDIKYFSSTKKGELAEMRLDLQSDKKEKKKDAVKKVIASMTLGKDVSSLFPDVINCIQTDNVELKKLVYLYLMNYAKSQPDMAIMAVNTFVKDCEDSNPLIRALSVRTMGCIRVDKITEYMCEPLRRCLKDDDAYVRKTAAVCVAKLHDINSSMVEDQGFLEMLRDLLGDSNPMVVANTVAALNEIADSSPAGQEAFDLTLSTVNKLLTALNECTEWGQVFILDSLAQYTPSDEREARSIAERVTPRLSHANAAVVLSAVRVLLKLMEIIDAGDYLQGLVRKLSPPLVTLLSTDAEVQYVALRNINLIVQKRSDVLQNEVKVFFVKYNDPIYVKLEKLDILIRLTNATNISLVLPELKEYATEVDVDFVRKAVRAIGRCAIKVESASERCVSTLVELINTKVNYVVQEAIVVIKDIFRKYPNKYENIISNLCENLDSLDEPEARASMIWIVGEYAERIDNASELLESFVENFADENPMVQLQLLTAIVKLFLLRPAEGQDIVQSVLSMATQESDNPDLRDRAYIYWRLLSTDPVAAREVVLAEKPLISEETDLLEPTLLDELICYLATLASVYHKPPSSFVDGKAPMRRVFLRQRDAAESLTAESKEHPVASQVGIVPEQQVIPQAAPQVIPQPTESLIGDLLSMDLGGGASPRIVSPTMTNPALDLLDEFGLGSLGQTQATIFSQKEMWLVPQNGKGMEIAGSFSRRHGQVFMDMTFSNRAMQALGNFAIQLNRNSFGLSPVSPLQVLTPLPPNQSYDTSLPLSTVGPVMRMEPLNLVQVAVKNNVDVFYLNCEVPPHVLFAEDGNMERKMFLSTWKEIPSQNEVQSTLEFAGGSAQAEERLGGCNVFTIAKRTVDNSELLYMTLKYTNGIWVLAELKFQPGQIHLALKTRALDVVPLTQLGIKNILSM